MATATKKNNALVKWDKVLAERAQQASATVEVGGGNFLSIQGGKLSYKKVAIPGNKLKCIILGHIFENGWNKEKFDPSNPQAPDCYAFGTEKQDMKPHEDSSEKQSESCSTCPKNEYGSADTGKGKACSNKYRIALVTEGGMEDIENAEVAFLRVPPTSMKQYGGYVKQLADAYSVPPLAVITELEAYIEKTYPAVRFTFVERIEDGDALTALINKADGTQLDTPYVKIEKAEKKPAKKGPVKARKF